MATVRRCLVLFCFIASAYGDCKSGWSRYIDSCYHLSRDIETWTEAMRMCEYHGATLAHIETAQEEGFISNMIHHHGDLFWLGGSDWDSEGRWVWEPDGTRITYTNWWHHEPNNGGHIEHCLMIHAALSNRWTDEPCHIRAHYICEMKRNNPLTTQTTTTTPKPLVVTTMGNIFQTNTTTKPISTTTPLE